jgi:nitrogen-specific signal transduction histidine kinase
MNGATIPILVALVLQLALGLIVFLANRHRKPNQCFLLLSFVAAGWLACLYQIFSRTDPGAVEFFIREASVAGALILLVLNLLRVSLRWDQESWGAILRRSRFWLVATVAIICLCHTGFFLRGAFIDLSGVSRAPIPIYGPGIFLYAAYFCGAMLLLIAFTWWDLRQTVGGNRAELGFLLIGGLIAVISSLPLALLLGVFFAPAQISRIAPFRVVLFSVVVAYGIATRKIMEVGLFIRRVISYTLLTLYLLALYVFVWWLVDSVLQSSQVQHAGSIAHGIAGLVIAFAMAPARGVSRRLAERLFITTQGLDFRATVSKAAEILSSITTLRDLLQRFASTILEAVGAERVVILLVERDQYVTACAVAHSGGSGTDCSLPLDGPITTYLKAHRESVVLDELHRVRPTAEVLQLSQRMRELNVAVAMGIFSREHLAGVMLLGPRMSGRIYGSAEQNALQVLCGQLAVAIDNAQLFTEVQNAKIYNETLLQNLTTGVIAAGKDEHVTVFNKEAGQITQLNAMEILDQTLDRLPAPLREALRATLRTGQSQENIELILQSGAEGMVVRASTSIFHGQDRQVLGALMVVTDITALKRLELQIRRSDRLASLGTLSAGMAHEIKNPLVSIKTFAQLLPERYNDSDFRETFSNLIGHEIDRIDSLVNQLLRFARPAKPHLQPMHVHEILEKSLLLLGHRLYQKDIKLTRSWQANVDTIRADADQLEQVFLNFFINAMDAMKNGGELSITTQIRTDEEWLSPLAQTNGENHEVLRITIRDSGEGIRGEDLAHVFDPFFTTKDYGTGLGLSVVHGIIQEHGGQIEVESELKKGTAFHILLPLVRFDREVAAA